MIETLEYHFVLHFSFKFFLYDKNLQLKKSENGKPRLGPMSLISVLWNRPAPNMRSAVQVETGSTGPVLERNQCSSPLIQFTRQLTAVDVHDRWKFQHQKGNLEMTACPT